MDTCWLTDPLMTSNDDHSSAAQEGTADETSTANVCKATDSPADETSETVDNEEDGDVHHEAEAGEMAAAMERRLATLPGKANESEPFTVFRVSGPMRERNRHHYEPQMVSIGPFHRDASARRLAAMEAHKWRYLRDLLARNPDASLATYARAALAMEPRARRRYAEPVPLPADEFAEMLLLDGCFLVEFFLKFEERPPFSKRKGDERADDALIGAAWALQNVYNDLLLLENQLPFFVLERFYAIATNRKNGGRGITDLLVDYLTVDMGTSREAGERRPPDGEVHHLLHLYYHWFLPPEESSKAVDENEAFNETLAKPVHERVPCLLPSASEMKDAGVKIRAKKSPRSLVDVAFHPHSGVLEIPTVDCYTNHVIFANMLAYEQSRGTWEMHRLVSYVLLMAAVAAAPHDVEVMQRAGVLAKADDDATAFYAQLRELCPPPEFVNNCYKELVKHVREYCGRSWNRHRAVLVHDYFSNPWTSMSAAAAVLLLVLTVVQTVYTVLPYYNPNNSSG